MSADSERRVTVSLSLYGSSERLRAACDFLSELADAQWENSWCTEEQYDDLGEVVRVARDVLAQDALQCG